MSKMGDDEDEINEPTLVLEALPPKTVDGRANVAYFRVQIDNLNLMNAHHIRLHGKPVTGMDSSLKAIERAAEWAGVDISAAADERTDAQKVADAVERLVSSGGEAVLELADDEIGAIESAMTMAVNGTADWIEKYKGEADERGREARGRKARELRQAAGKRWLSLLQRVRRLRDLARHPIPKDKSGWHSSKFVALEASHVLRYMLYVYRNDTAGSGSERSKMVYQIKDFHCQMAFRIWEAENRVAFFCKGSKEEMERRPDLYHTDGMVVRGLTSCDGLVLVCPPGHGKSSIGQAWTSLQFCLNPRLQMFMLHAQEDKAAQNMRHVKATFDVEESMGRRRKSLFPDIRLNKKADDNKAAMRLIIPERTRDPQLRAVGVRTSLGGANTQKQWWDDPVDKKERDEPNVRAATYRRLMHDVKRRQRGKNTFLFITATLWHEDDSVSRIIKESRSSQGRNGMAVCLIRCGGPEPKTDLPAWHSIWPEQYPSAFLRKIFNSEFAATPTDYFAQFMCDPKPTETRMVKKLAYYLCRLPEEASPENMERARRMMAEHRDFLKTAEFHLSLDPSSTSRSETIRTTDKAGLIYAPIGTLTEAVGTATSERSTVSRRLIRVLEGREFHAGPTEAVDEVGAFCAASKVDRVHVEVSTFSGAIIEMLRSKFNLSASQVIGHKTGSQKKEVRFRAVSTMFDDSLASTGVGRAVVQFPGVMDERGELVIAPEYQWLSSSILDFGSTKNDHAVDALVQLCKMLQSQVDMGDGDVTMSVMAAGFEPESERRKVLAERYAAVGEDPTDADPAQEEYDFWSGGVGLTPFEAYLQGG